MATQWTAGTSSGQVLTASTLNTIGAAWVDYTPTLTQGVTVTKTITNARYCQFQKTVIVQAKLVATSAGTAGQGVIVGLPIAARTNNATLSGIFSFYDASTNIFYPCAAQLDTTTTISAFFNSGFAFGTAPAITVANTDQIQISITYEVA